jgi:hypothetical protein
VDIVLQTNSENPSFTFRGLKRFEDGSGYSAKLVIRSGWVAAEYDFFFGTDALHGFLHDLEQIDQTLAGVARLKPAYEAQFIELRGDGSGHVTIHGDLIEHGAMEQRLQFTFATDQTCMRPFIGALRQIAG